MKKYRKCPHCGARVAITPQNPTGICPAYACPENRHFYKEEEKNKEAYTKRMSLTEKYKGLYFENSDEALHFFYGLDNNNMLFISVVDLALYVYSESELENLAKRYKINNLIADYSS